MEDSGRWMGMSKRVTRWRASKAPSTAMALSPSPLRVPASTRGQALPAHDPALTPCETNSSVPRAVRDTTADGIGAAFGASERGAALGNRVSWCRLSGAVSRHAPRMDEAVVDLSICCLIFQDPSRSTLWSHFLAWDPGLSDAVLSKPPRRSPSTSYFIFLHSTRRSDAYSRGGRRTHLQPSLPLSSPDARVHHLRRSKMP